MINARDLWMVAEEDSIDAYDAWCEENAHHAHAVEASAHADYVDEREDSYLD